MICLSLIKRVNCFANFRALVDMGGISIEETSSRWDQVYNSIMNVMIVTAILYINGFTRYVDSTVIV